MKELISPEKSTEKSGKLANTRRGRARTDTIQTLQRIEPMGKVEVVGKAERHGKDVEKKNTGIQILLTLRSGKEPRKKGNGICGCRNLHNCTSNPRARGGSGARKGRNPEDQAWKGKKTKNKNC